MAREFLRLTPETVWGTYHSASTPLIVDLVADNSFTMRPMPIQQDLRAAAGFNRRWRKISGKTEVKGNLNMVLPGSQGPAIAAWIDAGGAASPSSMTIDHCFVMEDSGATKVYRRYLGSKVAQAAFTASEQDQFLRLALQLQAKQPATITITDFAEPAITDYATDPLYVFEMSSGGVTVGTSRAAFDSLNITIKNVLDPRFFNNQYLNALKYCGRDVDWDCKFPYVITLDRTDYEALTAVSGAITFTNGSHSLAFAMNAQNFFAEVSDELALDKMFLQGVKLQAFVDATAGSDFGITAT